MSIAKKQTHIITYLDGKVVSETNSEYIDRAKYYRLLHNNKVLISRLLLIHVKCILLEEPSYLKEVKRLETSHASFEREYVKTFP
jgi:hypothetical protein